MVYRKYVNNKKFRIYEFEYFNLKDIEKYFNGKRIWRIGKFLSKVYKSRIRSRGNIEGDRNIVLGFVYVSMKDLVGILGKRHYEEILEKLSKTKILKYKRDKISKYDFNKKLWFIKLNDEFFKSNKRLVDIEDGLLNRYLEGKNNELLNSLSFINEDDKYLVYERECCKDSFIDIIEVEKIIDERIYNKLEEFKDKITWEWLNKRSREKFELSVKNQKDWKEKYRIELINHFKLINEDLSNLKSNNVIDIGENYFFRDNYGKRLYNFYSRVIREFRQGIKIDGEEVVEIDLKSSQLTLLYILIKRINRDETEEKYDEIKFDLVDDIRGKILELNNNEGKNGLDFLRKFKNIFEIDGVNVDDKNSIEFNDYYDLIRYDFGVDGFYVKSRNYIKELVIKILFSENRSKSRIKIGSYNIDDIEEKLFGKDGKVFLDNLRKIDLINLIGEKEGRIKYKRGKNISLILMNFENQIMDLVRGELIKNKIKFISMFDGFIVKKQYSNLILTICNELLKRVDNSLKFVYKGKLSWEDIVKK